MDIKTHKSPLLPQIFCTSKLEDQTPKIRRQKDSVSKIFTQNTCAEVEAWICSKTLQRIINLPEENERILEENGDTRIHNRLFCKRQKIYRIRNESVVRI